MWRTGGWRGLSVRRRVTAGALAVVLVLCLLPSVRHVRHPAYGFAAAAPAAEGP